MLTIKEYLSSRAYPGRGIILGTAADGRAALVYFIMGRSASSRARRFFKDGDDVKIKNIADGSPEHPELIFYSPLRMLGGTTIVTNGDQTDTVYEGLRLGGSLESALRTRCFEPDPPHFTPRISGLISNICGGPAYTLSILKAGDENGLHCERQYFDYGSEPGAGHVIHTYAGAKKTDKGDVLLSFSGEPVRVALPGSVEELANEVWQSLNEDNKVAMYVRLTDMRTGEYEDELVNKY